MMMYHWLVELNRHFYGCVFMHTYKCGNVNKNTFFLFHCLVACVSLLSVCEIVGQSDGGLSVLRTFRLLRVLKLVRFMPALRRQLVVLMKTMDNVATFCMLLMLFIFIFR